MDVRLRFEQQAADGASRWMFHPSQSMVREGRRHVNRPVSCRRNTGNVLAFADVGKAVTVEAPESLRLQLIDVASAAVEHHRGAEF